MMYPFKLVAVCANCFELFLVLSRESGTSDFEFQRRFPFHVVITQRAKTVRVLLDVLDVRCNLLFVRRDILLIRCNLLFVRRDILLVGRDTLLVGLNSLVVGLESLNVGSDLFCGGMQAGLNHLGRFQIVTINSNTFC
ncbi:MAG: hypothetical protein ACJ74Z_06130 [Bryobacteraceae bacterium]